MKISESIKWYRTKILKRLNIYLSDYFHKKYTGKDSSTYLALPLVIYYRISDAGYPKTKPFYINNENCLRNAVKHFPPHENKWVIIADNCSETTIEMIKKYLPENCIDRRSVGHGAGTFKIAYKMATKLDKDTPVYFLENDYLHRKDSQKIILEGLKLSPYVTLYDHPDKYDNHHFKVNHGGEITRVIISESCHWKVTHSTTMTFASKVSTLLKDKVIFERWIQTRHPNDCEIFVDLARKNQRLISPLPSYSTHGETDFLAPFIDWENEAN
jgi:hypothetical protein